METYATKLGNRPLHPKVLEVLERLRPLSPTRVVKDLLQPITGYLKPKILDPSMTQEISPKKTEKQEVHLNLNMNGMRNRRRTLVS